MRILLLIIALVTLAGCGQKGPLYLEKRALEERAQDQEAPEQEVLEQEGKSEKVLPSSTSRRVESQATLLIASRPATDQQGK